MLELLLLYYRYNAWANIRILDTATRLTPQQYRANFDVNFGTIHHILVHTIAVQWLWLSRWQGISPTAIPPANQFADLAELRGYQGQVEQDTQTFLADLTEERLSEPLSYTNIKGQHWVYLLWKLMLHQCNHATQHRSEVAYITSQLGISPGPMDFTTFLDQ